MSLCTGLIVRNPSASKNPALRESGIDGRITQLPQSRTDEPLARLCAVTRPVLACDLGVNGQQCPQSWSRPPANQPNPLSSGHFGAAGRQGHRQTYPLTTRKYAPGPSHWWARGGLRTPFKRIGQPPLYPQSYER